MAIHPCVGCVYFKQCGNTARTEPYNGRQMAYTEMMDIIKTRHEMILAVIEE